MGTTYHVTVVESEGLSASRETLAAAVEQELDDVDRAMSTYRSDSELSALNRTEAGVEFRASPALLEVLEMAQRVSRASDGAFDVTVGPLVDAWGFGPAEPTATPPSREQLEHLRQGVGYQKLEVDREAATVTKKVPGLRVDLSAIAKGYAVDRVGFRLEKLGFDRYMVEVGGEVRVRGLAAAGRPWRIAIESPTPGRRGLQRVVALRDRSIATSGDYRNFYEVDGQRFSHEIDPTTGSPVTHGLASVSVLDRSTALADAWATALIVLGPERGLEVAEQLHLAALLLVYRGDELTELQSTAFGELAGDG